MDPLSDAAEVFITLLVHEFDCELGNHAIGSTHACHFSTSTEALKAMCRRAYLKGREEALASPASLEDDIAMISAINAASRDE